MGSFRPTLNMERTCKLTEDKIAQNVEISNRTRPYFHSYLNYSNTTWCSNNGWYLKKLQSQQKHTNFSRNNYVVSYFKLTKGKYRITIRDPKIENNISNKEEKLIENPAIFKATTKNK